MNKGLIGGVAGVLAVTAVLVTTTHVIRKPSNVPQKSVSELERDLEVTLKKLDPKASIEGFRLPDSTTELGQVPADPKNPLNAAKIALGKALFFDSATLDKPQIDSSVKMSSCAACHVAEYGMTPGIRQGMGEGGLGHGEKRHRSDDYPSQLIDQQPIATPVTINLAYQELMLWDGSLGAVGPNAEPAVKARWDLDNGTKLNSFGYQGIETQGMVGQDTHRLGVTHIKDNPTYIAMFKAAFPSRAQSRDLINKETMALAIAAYMRSITTTQAPFQRFVRGERASDEKPVMLASQLRGSLLFFGKAGCFNCHSGPALNYSNTTHKMSFESVGYGDLLGADILNSDSSHPKHKGRYGFTHNFDDLYKYKVPQLYNLKKVKFLGHGGTFKSVEELVRYYNKGVAQNPDSVGSTSKFFHPLDLSDDEMADVVSFVVDGLYDPGFDRYVSHTVPSGLCASENDAEARAQLGCH